MPIKLLTLIGSTLIPLCLWQNALWAQKTLDDDASIGVPALFEYADNGVDSRRAESLTLGDSSTLADLGIAFDADLTHFYQGVASGGREQHFRYGGHGDYLFNIDGSKLCGQDGLFLQIRAEHRFGLDINTSTGALMPASILMSLPLEDDDDLVLSEYFATQFFSENIAVFAGKTARIEGDTNRFAAGRGRELFSNLAFVANPIPLLAIPYSSMSFGAFYTSDPQLNQYLRFVIIDPEDTTSTTGISDLFSKGVTLVAEGRLHTNLMRKSGHILVGGVWSSREFDAIGQDPRILFPPLNIPIARKNGTWAVFGNFDQYLVVDRCDSTRGWGIFGRAGISDGNPNPIKWYLSFGIGGNSPIRCRDQDSFGFGWYHLGLTDEFGPIANALLQPRDETGVELYYKAVFDDCLDITTDIQFVEPGVRSDAKTALSVGTRVNIEF